MEEIGKTLILLGIFLALAGVVIVVISKTSLPIGKLPGDILIKRDNFVFYFPLGTSLLLSFLLSLFSFLLFLILRKQ
ncbi:DUF2905 domain-containing protein [Thermovibrio sp.]